MSKFILVDNPDSICSELTQRDRVAVDTEFMREKTYYSQLCLVQVACGDTIYCVDPLRDDDLDAFWSALLTPEWVVHSGRQDIEVVVQAAQHMPARLFDTQVAAGLLGYAPQLGYASLVRELFDIDLPKSHTRANWARRPLSDEYLHYAAEDVEHLLPAYETLAEELDKRGRLAWAQDDSMELLDPELYRIDPGAAIDRLKGARNLRGKRRAAAARLAAWREREAMRANRPRQWIAKDSALLEAAASRPRSIDDLRNVDGLPAGLIRRCGNDILAAIVAADSDDGNYVPPRRPDEAQKALLKSMQGRVADHARELGIAAETLASKRDLVAVIFDGEQQSKLLRGWRREIFGDQLLQMI